jgi:hypothetical protein
MVIISSARFDERITAHVAAILAQLRKKPERFGIGEAGSALPQEQWYPPNTFHTYWTLEIFRLLKDKYPTEYDKLSPPGKLDLKRRRQGMLVWGRQELGSQIGLHSAAPPSSVLDSDQLAWALAIFLRFDESLNVDLENRDFIKQALKCLFSTQTDGTWRHYKPLFHYTYIGNAYCYVFETFAVLLECALQKTPQAEMVRELLRAYGKNLMDLWRYADSTKIPLPSGKGVGWCSGHRTNVKEPESWATASVFSYAQALRRLIGIWSREDSLNSLNAPRSRFNPEDAEKQMVERGSTWETGKTPVSEQLWTMFINPVRMHECDDKLEPDSQPIEEKHARSAILFGPPGTSKTTLVRRLADIIGWKYVELHASHFVAEGLTAVQKTADKIFKQLLELDHAVVLFDEIDELVRERNIEKDAFGRFLTTSMLPKLAELWDARKILYFVATNHINYFDSAIIRSNRFDALILVGPPSFGAKIDRLNKLLPKMYSVATVSFEVTEDQIQKELNDLLGSAPASSTSGEPKDRLTEREVWGEQELEAKYALSKFVLLRHDELEELAYRLAGILEAQVPASNIISADVLRGALMQIADSQWRRNKSYEDFKRDTQSERRDYQMLKAWELLKESAAVASPELVTGNGQKWLTKAVDSLEDIEIPGYELILVPPKGVKVLRRSS